VQCFLVSPNFESTFFKQMDNLIKLKEEHLPFVELKSSKSLKETDERAHITANVKLAIQSARIL